MSDQDGRVVLRSYRLAFELERRIHRIDRYRIPLPYGLPLEALGYATALLVAVLAAGGVPGIGSLLALLPLPVRLVFLPGLGAHLLCRATSDGRAMHEALSARLRFAVSPKRLVALRSAPPVEVWGRALVVWDERRPVLPAGVLTGPTEAVLCQPARGRVRRGRIELEQTGDRPLTTPRAIRLRAGERLVIR